MKKPRNNSQVPGHSIQVTVAELFNAQPVFRKLAAASLPAMNAFTLSRLINQLNPEFVAAETARRPVYQRHGVVDGPQIKVPPEKMPEVLAELEPLFSKKVLILAERLPLMLFETAPNMTAEEMLALGPFISIETLPNE